MADLEHPFLVQAEKRSPTPLPPAVPPTITNGALHPDADAPSPPRPTSMMPSWDDNTAQHNTAQPLPARYEVTDGNLFWLNSRPYAIHECIGKGGFGEVHRVELLVPFGMEVQRDLETRAIVIDDDGKVCVRLAEMGRRLWTTRSLDDEVDVETTGSLDDEEPTDDAETTGSLDDEEPTGSLYARFFRTSGVGGRGLSACVDVAEEVRKALSLSHAPETMNFCTDGAVERILNPERRSSGGGAVVTGAVNENNPATPAAATADPFAVVPGRFVYGSGAFFGLKLQSARSLRQLEEFKKEAENLEKLRNQTNIVQIRDHSILRSSLHVVILMELAACDLQTLFEHVSSSSGMGVLATFSIWHSLLASINAAHSVDIIHRDIKPQNFLLVPVGTQHGGMDADRILATTTTPVEKFKFRIIEKFKPGNTEAEAPGDVELTLIDSATGVETVLRLVVKLSDFGLAQPLDLEETHFSLEGHAGTIKYMAPETVAPSPDGVQRLSKRVDIWALGTMLFQMLHCGRTPYDRFLQKGNHIGAAVAIASEPIHEEVMKFDREGIWEGERERCSHQGNGLRETAISLVATEFLFRMCELCLAFEAGERADANTLKSWVELLLDSAWWRRAMRGFSDVELVELVGAVGDGCCVEGAAGTRNLVKQGGDRVEEIFFPELRRRGSSAGEGRAAGGEGDAGGRGGGQEAERARVERPRKFKFPQSLSFPIIALGVLTFAVIFFAVVLPALQSSSSPGVDTDIQPGLPSPSKVLPVPTTGADPVEGADDVPSTAPRPSSPSSSPASSSPASSSPAIATLEHPSPALGFLPTSSVPAAPPSRIPAGPPSSRPEPIEGPRPRPSSVRDFLAPEDSADGKAANVFAKASPLQDSFDKAFVERKTFVEDVFQVFRDQDPSGRVVQVFRNHLMAEEGSGRVDPGVMPEFSRREAIVKELLLLLEEENNSGVEDDVDEICRTGHKNMNDSTAAAAAKALAKIVNKDDPRAARDLRQRVSDKLVELLGNLKTSWPVRVEIVEALAQVAEPSSDVFRTELLFLEEILKYAPRTGFPGGESVLRALDDIGSEARAIRILLEKIIKLTGWTYVLSPTKTDSYIAEFFEKNFYYGDMAQLATLVRFVLLAQKSEQELPNGFSNQQELSGVLLAPVGSLVRLEDSTKEIWMDLVEWRSDRILPGFSAFKLLTEALQKV